MDFLALICDLDGDNLLDISELAIFLFPSPTLLDLEVNLLFKVEKTQKPFYSSTE